VAVEATTTAFVAGATGYVGREVVKQLVGLGIATHAHVRPSSGRFEEWRQRFEAIGANVCACDWTSEAIGAALANAEPTHVFSLLGTTRSRAKSEAITGDPYDKIDYGLTAMLYEQAATLASKPRFVYLSAAGVGDSARSAYMRARVRAEALVREGPLPYVLARPAVITGSDRDDRRRGEEFAGKAIDGALSVLGALGARKLRERYRSTTNTVLAAALIRLATESVDDGVVAEGIDLR